MSPQTFGRYRLLRPLGKGGMGEVWEAEDALLDRRIALKLISEGYAASAEGRQRFLREARAASCLHHPGIAAVFDAGEESGWLYIAFQRIEGETVSARLERFGPLPISKALEIALSAAEALQYSHSQGVLHRDVTSRNIMIGSTGQTIIVDFGLALAEDMTRFTKEGEIAGTAPYIAPEVIRGSIPDVRADVYGLGVVLFEMLTGRLPFSSPRKWDLLRGIVEEPPPPPSSIRPEIPSALDAFLLKSLAKKAEERFQTAAEFALRLQEANTCLDAVSISEARNAVFSRGMLADRVRQLKRIPGVTFRASRVSVPVQIAASLLFFLLLAGTLRGLDPLHWWTPDLRLTSLAVLPFVNESPAPRATDHLVRDMGETLARKLGALEGLRVSPWVSSENYGPSALTDHEIAQDLNVAALVAGSYRQTGKRLEAVVTIVDGENGDRIWSRSFQAARGNLFELEEDVARSLASYVKPRLTPSEKASLKQRPTEILKAYEHYLKGVERLQEETWESNRAALASFGRALELDPNLAQAHVGVGAVYAERHFLHWQGTDNLERAEASFREALSLDPDLPEAKRGLIHVFSARGTTTRGLVFARSVADTNTNRIDDLFIRAEAYLYFGFPSRAAHLFQRIIAMDPAGAGAHWYLVTALAWSAQYAAAIKAGDAYFRQFAEDPEIHLWIGGAEEALGHLDLAQSHYEQALRLFPSESRRAAEQSLGGLLVRKGEKEYGEALLRRGLDKETRGASPERLAYYVSLGDRRQFEIEASRTLSASRENDGELALLIQDYVELGEDEKAIEVASILLGRGVWSEAGTFRTSFPSGRRSFWTDARYASFREECSRVLAQREQEF